jgi:fructose-bisphosphate aldolase class I
MNKEELQKIAKQMVAEGKGILAADESMKTVGKRFASINLENNEANRLAFREMLLTAPGEAKYISGVILHDETIRQTLTPTLSHGERGLAEGKSFVKILADEGILPGIKVDEGLMPMNESSAEQVTKGLEGLADRLKDYVSLGAKFTKWRSVTTIGEGLPTDANIRQNAKDLAQYALICQQNGLVPMVEPEVLLEGSHSIEQASEDTTKILLALFEELNHAGVMLEGVILKSSMVLPGNKFGQKASPKEVAKATLEVFNKTLPKALAGVVFLSGGQGDIEATENLNAINRLIVNPHPNPLPGGEWRRVSWPLTFSFARALQDAATKVWQGKPENLAEAQKVFLHRAHMNSLASLGKYESGMEQNLSFESTATSSQD